MRARIAIAVQDPALEAVITRVLRECGHDPLPLAARSAPAARAAMRAAGEPLPDLVVVDATLPGPPGAAGLADLTVAGAVLLQHEREEPLTPSSRYDVVARPFDVDDLAHTITRRLSTDGLPFAGRFRIVRELGRGGYGAVYEAVDLTSGQRVALKVPATDATDLADQLRFIREAYTLASVRSEHVASIRAVGSAQGRSFYAMECVPGESVFARVIRAGPLDESSARAMLRGLLEALVAVHAAGLVHRDVKPNNVILRDGAPRASVLVDFGLARLEGDHGLTAPGTILGTPEFLAPETVREGVADHRSDLFAAGLTARWTLMGETGYPSSTHGLALLDCVANGPPPLPRAGASPEFAHLLDSLCAAQPSARPASAAAALAHLDALPGSAPAATRHRRPVDLAGPIVVVVEDDPALREVVRRCLVARGNRVLTTGSGEEALGLLEVVGARVDLLLADLGLPGMTGIDLAVRVRNDYPEVEIVLMSGAFITPRAEFRRLIHKPFTPGSLASVVADALERA